MRQISFIAVIALVSLLGVSNAWAFQVDQGSGSVKDPNTSNLADPDEQSPPFMLAPQDQSSGNQVRASSSVTTDQNAQREKAYGLSQGFDRAYSNQH